MKRMESIFQFRKWFLRRSSGVVRIPQRGDQLRTERLEQEAIINRGVFWGWHHAWDGVMWSRVEGTVDAERGEGKTPEAHRHCLQVLERLAPGRKLRLVLQGINGRMFNRILYGKQIWDQVCQGRCGESGPVSQGAIEFNPGYHSNWWGAVETRGKGGVGGGGVGTSRAGEKASPQTPVLCGTVQKRGRLPHFTLCASPSSN